MPSQHISTTSQTRLRAAMDRLLAGTQVRTDGRLIKENLYREAGVSRATMNRAADVLAEWESRVNTAQPRDREIETLRQQLSESRATIDDLRARNAKLEQQLTVAATAVAEQHIEIQALRGQDPTRVAYLRDKTQPTQRR